MWCSACRVHHEAKIVMVFGTPARIIECPAVPPKMMYLVNDAYFQGLAAR